jgi:hypothetical protein
MSDDSAVSKKSVIEFDLALLNLDDLSSAQQLYVSLRVFGIDGQKSASWIPSSGPGLKK